MNTDAFDWAGHYDRLHTPDLLAAGRRPVIGITGNFGDNGCELAEGYFASVVKAGAIPFIIPPQSDAGTLLQSLQHIDGLLLSGGADLNPLFIGEEPSPALRGINPRRDLPELLLIRLAYDRQIPLLGICRGCQMLAAALGGSIHQDIATECSGLPLVKHSQTLDRGVASHTVTVEPDSLLHDIMLCDKLAVNSFHHQAVHHTGDKLRASARAADGIIEAVESTEYKPIIGVQWHPEAFLPNRDESMMPLFHWLAGEASSYARARAFHRTHIVLDSHCDTPMFFDQAICFHQRDNRVLVDLHKMDEGGLNSVVMAAYLPQGERTAEGFRQARDYAESQLTRIANMVSHAPQCMEMAYTPEDVRRIHRTGKKAILAGIENGYAIGRDITLLKHFRDLGIVYMTLCHNGDNDICDSARRSNAEHGGLSAFGKKVVAEMNRLGIMVDLSHAAETTFYDAIECSSAPIICSHSSAKALCDVPRNLSDDQLRALATQGGVAQVTLYRGFLQQDGNATIDDAIRHINHFVEVMGIRHVGIGTDFDGDGGIPGCAAANELINLTRRLQAEGYSDNDLQLIWGGNFLHVMDHVQSLASLS